VQLKDSWVCDKILGLQGHLLRLDLLHPHLLLVLVSILPIIWIESYVSLHRSLLLLHWPSNRRLHSSRIRLLDIAWGMHTAGRPHLGRNEPLLFDRRFYRHLSRNIWLSEPCIFTWFHNLIDLVIQIAGRNAWLCANPRWHFSFNLDFLQSCPLVLPHL